MFTFFHKSRLVVQQIYEYPNKLTADKLFDVFFCIHITIFMQKLNQTYTVMSAHTLFQKFAKTTISTLCESAIV